MTKARDIATQGGSTLVLKQDFTAASQIDILNCFSSTYTNYEMTVNLTAASSGVNYSLFQFLSGTTPSTSSYYFGYNGYTSSASNFNAAGSNAASAYFMEYNSGGIGQTFSKVTFQQPNKSTSTSFSTDIGWDSGTAIVSRRGGGGHLVNASYTGIRIITNAGTITGTVRIYGIRD